MLNTEMWLLTKISGEDAAPGDNDYKIDCHLCDVNFYFLKYKSFLAKNLNFLNYNNEFF